MDLPTAATLTGAPDLSWLGTIASSHPWGAAAIAVLTIVGSLWARSLLGRLVEYTDTPIDDKALRIVLWIADALTSKGRKPGAKVTVSARLARQDKALRSDPELERRAIEAGALDAQPMKWPDD